MEQGLVPNEWLNRRVAILDQYASRMAAYEAPDYQWNFRAAVSCPPSTVIHVRGGRVWGDPVDWDGKSWYVEGASYDLADEDVIDYRYTFINPHYYKPLAVMLHYSGNPIVGTDPPLTINTSGEWATAALAEEAAYPTIAAGGYEPNAWDGIPLGIFIMRNNGNTTDSNQFMPIDRVNRGRSYMWRDIKLRFQW